MNSSPSASPPVVIREDFRIRKTPRGYRVFQRIGSGWEALADIHPTREQARIAVKLLLDAGER
jgi:hypothetical protein